MQWVHPCFFFTQLSYQSAIWWFCMLAKAKLLVDVHWP